MKRISCTKTKLVNISDEYRNITTYIAEKCNDEDIQNNDCHVMECKTNSDCLSNKCVNKNCTYNEEDPIIHCDDIYTPPKFIIKESSYMHCGKTIGY